MPIIISTSPPFPSYILNQASSSLTLWNSIDPPPTVHISVSLTSQSILALVSQWFITLSHPYFQSYASFIPSLSPLSLSHPHFPSYLPQSYIVFNPSPLSLQVRTAWQEGPHLLLYLRTRALRESTVYQAIRLIVWRGYPYFSEFKSTRSFTQIAQKEGKQC